MVDFAALAAEFPRDAIHWRAQTLTKSGDKAMALAYLDARDVMDRLDDVCGPENWQDDYFETAKGRLICRLSIRVGDEWVAKSDGAGETDIEGEKGAISGALKRAAVKWGIGRYLYDMPAPWVPCDTYESGGKNRWSKWTADPWDFVRGEKPGPKPVTEPGSNRLPKAKAKELFERLQAALRKCETPAAYDDFWQHEKTIAARKSLPEDWERELIKMAGEHVNSMTDAAA